MKNKKALLTGAAVLIVLAIVLVAVYLINRPSAVGGSKNIVIEVIGSNGEAKDYNLTSSAEYLREAMDELAERDEDFSYSGTGGSYGLMVEEINGERALYAENGAYWALYLNDEYAQYGADAQPIAEGDKFSWIYEIYTD